MTSNFEPRRRARRRALQALYQWQVNQQPAGEIIGQFLAEQDFSNVDRDYFEALLAGITGDAERLDAAVAPYLQRQALDQMERAILRIGACELLDHLEVPFKLAIDEAVDLAHRFGGEQSHTLVNSVLDRLSFESRKIERGQG
jgi:transcription antitermination protein NusB